MDFESISEKILLTCAKPPIPFTFCPCLLVYACLVIKTGVDFLGCF
nr:MAG TPA: hypothetical protein [Caudoviricetes sp.]